MQETNDPVLKKMLGLERQLRQKKLEEMRSVLEQSRRDYLLALQDIDRLEKRTRHLEAELRMAKKGWIVHKMWKWQNPEGGE